VAVSAHASGDGCNGPASTRLDGFNLLAETDAAIQAKTVGEVLNVPQYFSVPGESRPRIVTPTAAVERVVAEGHQITWQVGAQGVI
jgi:hypothetical protein